MKKYCLDTSGISNPLESMPADIHESMWTKVIEILKSGCVAVTPEIYDEMIKIPGIVGDHIRSNKDKLILEVNKGDWNWSSYLTHSTAIINNHRGFISEYCGGSPKTVSLNDISIIALSKSLDVPCISMEVSANSSTTKRRIPDICLMEDVKHLTFSEFLRAAQIKI